MTGKQEIGLAITYEDGSITLTFLSDLDPSIYNIPFTFKTYIPESWKNVKVMSDDTEIATGIDISKDDLGYYIIYNASPLQGNIVISVSI